MLAAIATPRSWLPLVFQTFRWRPQAVHGAAGPEAKGSNFVGLMAVYIKQSPPREGVRGGWEDFNWESLKSQSFADRDYYLGASAKVGICTRGKFEKFDWWTKKKEAGGQETAADDELRRVKRFEQQLLDEALGRRPRLLLAGEALPDEEPPRADAGLADAPDAAKALRKLKKEHKRLKKLKKKEQKREARRLRMLKRERRSDSRSSRDASPSSRKGSFARNEARGESNDSWRRHHRRSRSVSGSLGRAGTARSALRLKRHLSEDSGWSEAPAKEMLHAEPTESDRCKRRQTHNSERGHLKRSRRSRSLQRERHKDRDDCHQRERSLSKDRRRGRKRSDSDEPRDMRRLASREGDGSKAVTRHRDSQIHGYGRESAATQESLERRKIKSELIEKEQDGESRRHGSSPRDARNASAGLGTHRMKREH